MTKRKFKQLIYHLTQPNQPIRLLFATPFKPRLPREQSFLNCISPFPDPTPCGFKREKIQHGLAEAITLSQPRRSIPLMYLPPVGMCGPQIEAMTHHRKLLPYPSLSKKELSMRMMSPWKHQSYVGCTATLPVALPKDSKASSMTRYWKHQPHHPLALPEATEFIAPRYSGGESSNWDNRPPAYLSNKCTRPYQYSVLTTT